MNVILSCKLCGNRVLNLPGITSLKDARDLFRKYSMNDPLRHWCGEEYKLKLGKEVKRGKKKKESRLVKKNNTKGKKGSKKIS